jgi:anti-sigma factor RsiW
MADDGHQAFQADFSDLYDRSLPEARVLEITAHLATCSLCKDEYERFRGTVGALSGLNRLAAPPSFDDQVAATIHRRSAGRRTGRRAFGDRIPFEILAVVALVVVAAVYWFFRSRG